MMILFAGYHAKLGAIEAGHPARHPTIFMSYWSAGSRRWADGSPPALKASRTLCAPMALETFGECTEATQSRRDWPHSPSIKLLEILIISETNASEFGRGPDERTAGCGECVRGPERLMRWRELT
jgi:hypothetical protein